MEDRRQAAAEAGFAVTLIGVAAIMVLLAVGFPAASDPLGPAFLPCFVALALAGLAILILVRRRAYPMNPEAATISHSGAFRRVALAVAALFAFFLALASTEGLGIPVLGPLLLIALSFAFGGRLSVGSVAVSILVVEATYFAFRNWFGLPLPPSAWF
jgi:hypothetical protein